MIQRAACAVLAVLAVIGSEVRAQEVVSLQAEWESYLEEVAAESPHEAIDRLDGPFPATGQQRMVLHTRRGDPLETALVTLDEDPRMRALRRTLARADDATHEDLIQAVNEKLAAVLHARQTLDEPPEPGDPPSGIALIALAAQYDRTGATLPVLLAWHEAEGPRDAADGVIGGSEAQFVPAAVAVILDRLDADTGEAGPRDPTRSMRGIRFADPGPALRTAVMERARARVEQTTQ